MVLLVLLLVLKLELRQRVEISLHRGRPLRLVMLLRGLLLVREEG